MAKHSAPPTAPHLDPLGGGSLVDGQSVPSGIATDQERDSRPSPAPPCSASAALHAVAAACATAGIVEVSLDVTDLDLTDSASRQALVALAAALRSCGGRMVLVGLSGQRLLTALHAASLTEVFVLWETLRQDRAMRPGVTSAIRSTSDTPDTAAANGVDGITA